MMRQTVWRHPDDTYWGQRDDLPSCGLDTTITVNAQILKHLAGELGNHDSAARSPVREVEIEEKHLGVH